MIWTIKIYSTDYVRGNTAASTTTVTTASFSGLPCQMFPYPWKAKSARQCPEIATFEERGLADWCLWVHTETLRKRTTSVACHCKVRSGSNRGSPAYPPNGLPPGQSGSRRHGHIRWDFYQVYRPLYLPVCACVHARVSAKRYTQGAAAGNPRAGIVTQVIQQLNASSVAK